MNQTSRERYAIASISPPALSMIELGHSTNRFFLGLLYLIQESFAKTKPLELKLPLLAVRLDYRGKQTPIVGLVDTTEVR